MQCGILCNKDGKVKRTWALVSDTAIVPVEHGDQVIEWDVDHGETLPHTQEKLSKIRAAVEEQEHIIKLASWNEAQAHIKTRGHAASERVVVLAAPSNEPVYYGSGKGLHHRTATAGGNIQESATDASNKLHLASHHKPVAEL